MDGLEAKYVALRDWLCAHAPLALAFSGGLDSCFLLAACRKAGIDCTAITVDSVLQSATEREDAYKMTQGSKWLRISVDLLAVDGVRANMADHCYWCKREMFTHIIRRAEGRSVIDGTNYDDLGDFRPGMRALRELGVLSPLSELKWTKADVREMSRRMNLSFADKPAEACLASRIPQGERIEPGKLRAVDMAENAIKHMGFKRVRVRVHGDIARIELDRDMLAEAAAQAGALVSAVKAAGFKRAALDLDGYSAGGVNIKRAGGR